MGGFDNERGQKLTALINTTSGGTDTTITLIRFLKKKIKIFYKYKWHRFHS
jgi:hypothetical protein